MEFVFTELKNIVKSLNKAKITKNRIKLTGGKEALIGKFLDEMELIIDSGLSSNVPEDVVDFYEKLSKDSESEKQEKPEEKTEFIEDLNLEDSESEKQEKPEEKTEFIEDLNLDDSEIWYTDETFSDENEEFLMEKSKEVKEISFDEKNKPIYSTMSIFANIMDIYISHTIANKDEIEVGRLMTSLRRRGIQTTRRYAMVRLKHAKDMFSLLGKRNMLKGY